MKNELLAHCIRERANGRHIDLGFVKRMCARIDGTTISDALAMELLVKANTPRPRAHRQAETGITHWRMRTCER